MIALLRMKSIIVKINSENFFIFFEIYHIYIYIYIYSIIHIAMFNCYIVLVLSYASSRRQ